jgi:mannose-6-phosphate isomerase-like protein (cupin superfamily)
MPTPVRRVVTGHDAEGRAIVVIDDVASNTHVRPGVGTASTQLWMTHATPADVSVGGDAVAEKIGITPPKTGSVFRIVEYPPDAQRFKSGITNEEALKELGAHGGTHGAARHPGMHRTESIDYAIILSGEIDMLLDVGEVHLEAGDVVVQQATLHAWANRGSEPCRIAFILIGADAAWAE